MNFISYGIATVGIGLAVFFYKKDQSNYRKIDLMMDEVLSGKKITISDLEDEKISSLASKAIRIQEKLKIEIDEAENERDQVKKLISNMSHQLKTPLANVMMYQELLEDENLQLENRKKFQGKMKNQLEKIHWILNSLFKMVRLEQNAISFEAENLSIKKTLTRAVNGVIGKAENKDISINIDEFLDIVLWHNEKWTSEALENILENAVKYSDKGGKITISLHKYEMYTAISIIDNGRGIKKEEQIKIFHRFYRSPDVEDVEGSGIGLYLSKLIVEKENGYITVESQYKKGTKFTVLLQNCKN